MTAPFTRVSTQKFARQFTEKYPAIAEASPAFAELQSLFDLAVLAALIRQERLTAKAGWPMSLFLDSERAATATRTVPKKTPSISNFKVVGNRSFIAQVSGGVSIDPFQIVQPDEFENDSSGKVRGVQVEANAHEPRAEHRWWWD